MAGGNQEFCFANTGVLDANLTAHEVWRGACQAMRPP
jgi:hypothetical protein